MLSVTESAKLLGVSAARVRALIESGSLPAVKVGRAWTLREEDVIQRLSLHPAPGRPAKRPTQFASVPSGDVAEEQPSCEERDEAERLRLKNLYFTCKDAFALRPSPYVIARAESSEEAAFYMAVADFFLQQKQRELVKSGVY
ncbi:helix-turn-helix domain-containing protein [Adlercreutzia sp. ZJ138]|uniref:helix-turn-helix domain-containing protein n=1 Tax=Adlercreutzia sp. ZJ138 TaxID=2709405 RepID=UPI0013ECD010|nr:helix-turn-helix domain-containing protein [Adlercreutzia sp. ZJ138]